MSRNRSDVETVNAAPALRFEGVSLAYGPDEAPVLRDASFVLPRGSLHVLTGPSGSGKSTLLKLAYLALRPSQGRVELFGHDVDSVRRADLPLLRRRVGVVFQEFRLLEHLSAFDNVALPLRVAGKRASKYRDDVEELLTWVGLKDKLGAAPSTLSGGEKQRLAIARAVVARPDLILADEPTGNVDPEMSLRLLRLFLELHRLGATVLIATHDQALLRRAQAPILRLEAGRLAVPTPGPIVADR